MYAEIMVDLLTSLIARFVGTVGEEVLGTISSKVAAVESANNVIVTLTDVLANTEIDFSSLVIQQTYTVMNEAIQRMTADTEALKAGTSSMTQIYDQEVNVQTTFATSVIMARRKMAEPLSLQQQEVQLMDLRIGSRFIQDQPHTTLQLQVSKGYYEEDNIYNLNCVSDIRDLALYDWFSQQIQRIG